MTLTSILTLDNWVSLTRPVTEKRPFMLVFFMSYIFIVSFSIMSIVVGVIVEQTFQAASSSLKAERYAKVKAATAAFRDLQLMFESSEGTEQELTQEMFQDFLANRGQSFMDFVRKTCNITDLDIPEIF